MVNAQTSNSTFRKIDTLIYERWFHRIFSHWHLFVISIGIAWLGSYFYLKYSTTVYTVSGSILVKDASQNINPFESKGFDYSAYARNINLQNEMKIFSSKKLIEETVKKLDWKVSYYIEGTIKASQLYKFNEFKLNFSDSNNAIPYNKIFYIKVLDNEKFELKFKKDENRNSLLKNPFYFNKEYEIDGFKFSIDRASDFNTINKNALYYFKINEFGSVVNEYISKIRVSQLDKSSSILTVQTNGTSADKEIDFINQHSVTFIKLNLLEKNITNERAILFIDTQLDMISDTLSKLENSLAFYRKKYNSNNVDLTVEKRFGRLELFEEEKSKYNLNLKYFNYLKEYLKTHDNYEDLVVPISLGIEAPMLTTLLNQLFEEKTKQKLYFKPEPGSPFRTENENKITAIKQSIYELISNIEKTNEIYLDDLNSKIKSVQDITISVLENERNFVELKRKYRINEELYNLLLKKKSEMSIIRAGNVSDTKIVDNASITGAPFPNISKVYSTNLLISILIPLLYVLFKYLTNYRIMERDDVTNICNIPFLGTIGHIPDNDNLVIINKPKSSLAESFRSIRANLSFFMPEENQKVILITSSLSGDGKTFTSLNIASIIAISNKKIVLIGADMRKPKVYLDIDTRNTDGLSNYLAGKATVEDIVRETKISNLSFISSGPVPPNPAELLMSSKLEELIFQLKLRFDYVIIDTPPIGLVSDALTIMKYSDVNIFVVRHDYTQSRYLKELNEHIEADRIKNITYILNDFDVRKNYGYGYRYYGYYSSEYGGGYGYGYGASNKHGYYDDEIVKKKSFLYNISKRLNKIFNSQS
ncbi:MAG: polysaccharide biosynthesis tyrosine autokinase [Bacteroidota bacterium]|nr:polysaccharide biosynthesis tyrosine autokinase [Bacteroidota bacterium]